MVYGILFFVLFAFTLSLAFLLSKCLSKSQTKNVPKGSLGYPIIGETLSFLKAQRQDKGSVWLEERISKYGPIFKTSLMGFPTVFVIGQEGNKFVLGSPDDLLSSKKPLPLRKILGRQSLVELTGPRENETIGAVVFMKKLSYEIACNLLFDIKDEHTKEALFVDFTLAFKAIHSLPINLPGTTFWRGQKAKARIVDRMIPIMNKRREELSKGYCSIV
ncbi:hypothetical protein JHK82_025143 [Glycine max]|nr:hypothetical protein JHK82_025143 [Glycine max]